jgi:hypothetical protein
MKTILTLILTMATVVVQAQTMLWAGQLGGTSNDGINAMVTDASGNVYTTGKLEGIVDFDPGPSTVNLASSGTSDAYIAKYDASGNLVWAKQVGSAYTTTGEAGNGIAVGASGNVYVTGVFRDTADMDPGAGVFNLITVPYNSLCLSHLDVFVLKLSSDGDFVWAKQIGGNAYDVAAGIAIGTDESVHITGEYASEGGIQVDFDPGTGVFNLYHSTGTSAFILKLDSEGSFIWAGQFTSNCVSAMPCGYRNGNINPRAISVDVAGNVYSTGRCWCTGDFDPGASAYSLAGGVYVSKLNSSGGFVWAKNFGGDGKDIAVDGSGNVYTTGNFSGTVDFNPGTGKNNLKATGNSIDIFVSKLDASGNYVWAKAMGGTADDYGNSIVVNESGSVITTGNFSGTSDFNPASAKYNLSAAGGSDAFISKLNSSGNFVWAVRLGGTLNDGGFCIALDGSGNVWSIGAFEGTADFDPSSSTYNLTSAGGADAYIHKMTGGAGRMEEPANGAEQYTVNAFPNPASANITLLLEQEVEDASVSIYNLTGQIMGEVKHVSGTTIRLDLTSYKPGIYFIEVNDGNGYLRIKILKSE